MNETLCKNAQLVGVISEDPDPAAQLLGGQLRAQGQRIVSSSNARALIDVTERLLVTSQHIYLADISTFEKTGKPVDLVIRRPRLGESEAEWHTGLQLIKRCLAQGKNSNVKLRALSKPAALAIKAIIGRDIIAFCQLPSLVHPLALATIQDNEIRFIDGSDTNRMPLCDLNWWRMRQKKTSLEAPESPQDIQDLVGFSNGVGENENANPTSKRAKSFLFIVSNGVGLGHLTRLLAIAEKLKGHIVFWSYSQAAQLIAQRGFSVMPRMTAEHLETDSDAWNEWEAEELVCFVGQNPMDAIIYDGSSPSNGLIAALRRPELGDTSFVWIRRGMWHADADATPIELTHHCDLVIEPGDLAASCDIGPTETVAPKFRGQSKQLHVDPIVATSSQQQLSRRKARASLRHRSLRPLCLVNLGGDTLGDHAPLVALLERIAPTERIRFLWLRSPFAAGLTRGSSAIGQVRYFPISHLLNGFDGIISAAGYNSFHEVLSLSRAPVLFAPNQNARLDDQYARAKYAESQGWAHVLETDAEVGMESQLAAFLDIVRRKSTRRSPIIIADGAAEIANAISDLNPAGIGKRT